jgi:hypothetical protein
MAESISLGASVLAFITITVQLSKITAGLYVTLNDAPEDIARLRTRLEDLHFILSEINRLRSSFPDYDTSSEIQRYWNDKSKRLELDFKEFRKFTDGLNTKDVKGKIRWFLSHRDHAKTVLVVLSEDIDILRSLYQIMES